MPFTADRQIDALRHFARGEAHIATVLLYVYEIAMTDDPEDAEALAEDLACAVHELVEEKRDPMRNPFEDVPRVPVFRSRRGRTWPLHNAGRAA